MSTYDKEYIIRYVEGELSPEEALALEAAQREDAVLAAEIALYRELRAVLQERLVPDPGAEALRGTLQGMNRKYFGGARVIPFRRYLAGLAAAAVVLFAVMRLWPSGSYLDRYGRTEMISNTERGDGNDPIMAQASAYFNGQDYAKALPLLDRAYRADSSDQSALFYRGVSRLYTGAIADGRNDLEKIYNGVSLFKYDAAFYIALSYAQQKDKATAGIWLGKIPAGAPVSDKAKALRKQLE